MRKKLFNASTFIFCILLFICPYETKATSIYSNETTTYEYFDDCSFLATSIAEDRISRISGTKTGHKTQYYCDSAGNKLWSVSVSGTFTYTGSSSKCTAASVTSTIYNSDWKITNTSASHSGNTAIATAIAKKYYLSSVIATKTLSVNLSCDKDGNLY